MGPELSAVASDWYGVTEEGNFEGRTILRRPLGAPLARPPTSRRHGSGCSRRRGARVRPGLDDKVLTEWNAMFGSALAEAAAATGRRDWAEAAVRGRAEFLLAELRPAGSARWLRSWQDGRARHLAYAGDYAWLVDFFTRLAELTGRAVWLDHARATAVAMLELFGATGRSSTRRDTTPSHSWCALWRSSTAPSPPRAASPPPRCSGSGPCGPMTGSPGPGESLAVRARASGDAPSPGQRQQPGRVRVGRRGRHRGGGHRGPARPPRHGQIQVRAVGRRGLGRAEPVAAVDRTRRRARLCVPALGVPGTGVHRARARPTARGRDRPEADEDGGGRAHDDPRRARRLGPQRGRRPAPGGNDAWGADAVTSRPRRRAHTGAWCSPARRRTPRPSTSDRAR